MWPALYLCSAASKCNIEYNMSLKRIKCDSQTKYQTEIECKSSPFGNRAFFLKRWFTKALCSVVRSALDLSERVSVQILRLSSWVNHIFSGGRQFFVYSAQVVSITLHASTTLGALDYAGVLVPICTFRLSSTKCKHTHLKITQAFSIHLNSLNAENEKFSLASIPCGLSKFPKICT
jgi:hypothetical protein